VIALLFAFLVLEEKINWNQILGCMLIILGIVAIFIRKSA